MNTKKLIKNIINDIRVDLDEAYDQNFEKKYFFGTPWAPLSKNYHPTTGSMLLRTGMMRKSLFPSKIKGTSLIYTSSVPYTGLQNDGGTIHQSFVPSPKQRKWAWAQFHETKDEKYRRIALCKRINRTFTVPARPFIGDHQRVRDIIEETASDTIAEAVAKDMEQLIKKK